MLNNNKKQLLLHYNILNTTNKQYNKISLLSSLYNKNNIQIQKNLKTNINQI